MGESPSRWLGLKAHYGVTYSGQIYRVHPEEELVWHAQQLSKTEIGIEISGFFCGIDGDLKTRPGGPKEWAIQSVTPEQVVAVKELVRYLVSLVASHGGKLAHLHAHRQSTDDRTPDPGSRVWQEIAMPLMAELGLSDGGPGWVVGKGQPIPKEWDPRSNAKY
jgi:N-acetyl-anhydromuramyl-L-alanine amidase AmpD